MLNDKRSELEEKRMINHRVDIVMRVTECINDLTEDNGVEFQTNLSLYLEGLEEDVLDLKFPHKG